MKRMLFLAALIAGVCCYATSKPKLEIEEVRVPPPDEDPVPIRNPNEVPAWYSEIKKDLDQLGKEYSQMKWERNEKPRELYQQGIDHPSLFAPYVRRKKAKTEGPSSELDDAIEALGREREKAGKQLEENYKKALEPTKDMKTRIEHLAKPLNKNLALAAALFEMVDLYRRGFTPEAEKLEKDFKTLLTTLAACTSTPNAAREHGSR